MTYTNPEDRARNDKFRAEQPAKVLAAIKEEQKQQAIREREAALDKLTEATELLERAYECLGGEFRELQNDIAAFLDEPEPDVAF